MKNIIVILIILVGCAGIKQSKKIDKENNIISQEYVYPRYNVVGYSPFRDKKMLVMSEKNLEGQKWFFKSENDSVVLKGIFFKSITAKGPHTPMPYNYEISFSIIDSTMNLVFHTEGAKPAKIKIRQDPYGSLIEEPLRYMRVARCGSEDCFDHGLCHLGDTACLVAYRQNHSNKDWKISEKRNTIDASGGWHDAGDYLKMSLTIAYTTYFLLKAYEVNPIIFKKKYSKTDLVDILDEAKWGLKWLMKAMPDTNSFIIQIGDMEDHSIGLRLAHQDKLDGKRPALLALSPTQLGYSAAALALGSKIFRSLGDEKTANKYQLQAELYFRRALSPEAKSIAWYTANFHFYNDESKYDNLELAASELYKLTNKQFYLDKAIEFGDKTRSSGWRSWEDVSMASHLSLMNNYKIVKNDLRLDLDNYQKVSKSPGNVWSLPTKYVWAGLYTYIGVANAAFEYQLQTKNRRYELMALNLLDYVLGKNNWGICFVATKKVPYSIQNPFSQTYTLQADLFPTGAISEGPGDSRSHSENSSYFGFDETIEPTYKFNTDKGVFYDHDKDFMCMETIISGIADGIYLLSLASKLYNS